MTHSLQTVVSSKFPFVRIPNVVILDTTLLLENQNSIWHHDLNNQIHNFHLGLQLYTHMLRRTALGMGQVFDVGSEIGVIEIYRNLLGVAKLVRVQCLHYKPLILRSNK